MLNKYDIRFDKRDVFTQEFIECLDCFNKFRFKLNFKGLLPAIHRQQALAAA